MTLLRLEQVGVQLGGRPVLNSISSAIGDGELVGLIGANGCGKTTLLRVVATLLPPDQGQVSLDGKPMQQIARRSRARQLAYLPQGADCHWPLPVRQLVTLGRLPWLRPWQRAGSNDTGQVQHAMAQADVLHLAERDALSLSGGERARVMLARALATGPQLLLADEPIAGLDPAHQLAVMSLLRRRADAGMTVLVSLHDLALALRYCDRLLVLQQGRLVADGDAAEVLDADLLASAFGIEALRGKHQGQATLQPWRQVGSGPEA